MYGGQVPHGTREAVGSEIRDIMEKCHGEAGREKRRNAQWLKGELAMAWSEKGGARAALQAFLDKCR